MKLKLFLLFCFANILLTSSVLACGFSGEDYRSTSIATSSSRYFNFMSEDSDDSDDDDIDDPGEKQLPFSCVRGPSPRGGAAVYLHNDVAKSFLAGQYPTPGWNGGWGARTQYDCKEHIRFQSRYIRKLGLDPSKVPVACAPTRQYESLCYSDHIPIVLNTNQPLLDPRIYTASFGKNTGEVGDYYDCVDDIAPLFASKKACISAIKENAKVFVLVALDLETSKISNLGEFAGKAECLERAKN